MITIAGALLLVGIPLLIFAVLLAAQFYIVFTREPYGCPDIPCNMDESEIKNL